MEWRSIAGYEGRYEVSDEGQVRSLLRNKILRPAHNKGGYELVNLYRQTGSRGATITVHKLVARAFLGEKPPGMEVNHKDCNKTNNRSDNLEYVTPLQNTRHAIEAGRRVVALARNAESRKLTDRQVQELRAIHFYCRSHGLLPKLAKAFQVSKSAVRAILAGRTYGHVTARDGAIYGPFRTASRRITRAALTTGDVVTIRKLAVADLTHGEIARRFGVSRVTVLNVINRNTWKQI